MSGLGGCCWRGCFRGIRGSWPKCGKVCGNRMQRNTRRNEKKNTRRNIRKVVRRSKKKNTRRNIKKVVRTRTIIRIVTKNSITIYMHKLC